MFLLIVIFTFVINFISAKELNNCPEADFQASQECTGFFRCSSGIKTFIKCPKDLLYDQTQKSCNWKELTKCSNPSYNSSSFKQTFEEKKIYSKYKKNKRNHKLKKHKSKYLCTYLEFHNALINNGYNKPSTYQYKNFVKQAFPKGGINTKIQLAIFLAEIIWESAGLQASREYACFPNLGPNCAYSTGIGMANKNYFGRGYIQLSWDYNYKAASHYLFGNEILIKNPDIVALNDDVAWSTAFWFWKEKVIKGEHGNSVLAGNFGSATNAINGGLECSGSYQYIAKKRFEIYKIVLAAFNIRKKAKETGCYN